MLLLNLDEPLCINEALTEVQPAGQHSPKTGDICGFSGPLYHKASISSDELVQQNGHLFFILLQFNVGVTRWPKYIFFTTLFLFVFSIFSSQALLHVLLAPDLPPPLIVIQGSFPAGRLHWHMFANNGLATLITQSSPVQIFPNVFISEANHWKPRGISYSYLP